MARIRSVPTMGFEGVQNVNYDNMLTATMFGEQAKLNASNQKNARIRQALADAEAERNLSSQNQAKFSALLNSNPDVMASMDEAPESVKKAFRKALNGKASASDNAVVLAYAQASANEIEAENAREIQRLQLQAAQRAVSPEAIAAFICISLAPKALALPANMIPLFTNFFLFLNTVLESSYSLSSNFFSSAAACTLWFIPVLIVLRKLVVKLFQSKAILHTSPRH